MTDYLFPGLTVCARKSTDNQRYEFGVVVDDVFVCLGAESVGGFEGDLAEAKAAKEAAAEADANPAVFG